MHGVTDNSNPGVLSLSGITSYNNSGALDNDPTSPTFGKIIATANKDTAGTAITHGNIDVSRQTYSYNNLNNILSVGDALALSLDSDAYRGAVTDSVLYAGSKSNFIVGSVDADTKNDGGVTYTTQKNAISSSDVFEKLPFVKEADGTYTFNITGLETLYEDYEDLTLNPQRIHLNYRNDDGSVNMGDILAKKEGVDDSLLIEGKDIGSTLNKANWEAYDHFYADDLVDGDAVSEDKAKVDRAAEALNINCDPANVYQDFDVPSKMIDCTIVWTSEDENVLVVGTDKDISISDSEYIMIHVYRDDSEAKTVKLTATLTCGEATATREFNVTVMPGIPSIGDIFVTAADGTEIYNGGNLVIDRYTIYREPEVSVKNGLDYNGKLLTESQYKVETTYVYQTDSTAEAIEVSGFSPSTAGVYTITHKVTLKSDETQSSTMSYKVYTASMDANVQFVGIAALSLNLEGYTIKGTISSATGYIYAVSSDKQLELTADTIKNYEGVEFKPFRSESIDFKFKNENSGAYYIYYALANQNGKVTSEVFCQPITVVNIDSTDKFMKIAGGDSIDGETAATTIYNLTKSLDFTDVSYKTNTASFKGLFNGNGYSIKNVTTEGQGLIYKVDGGTIRNVKFDNISVEATTQKVGIVIEMASGYLHNIQVLNSKFTGPQRVSSLVGSATEGANPIYISNIYVDDKTTVFSTATRAGGIIGHIQSSSSPVNPFICYISDCLVSAKIEGGNTGVGGIVGEYDPNKIVEAEDCYLEIARCVFNGEAYGQSSSLKTGGMVGDQKGACVMVIDSCISVGKLYYTADGKKTELLTAQKNSSGIIGGSTAETTGIVTVTRCLALMEEYNSDFDVTSSENISMASQFVNRLTGDFWTFIYVEGSTDTVEAPYVQLNFIGNWDLSNDVIVDEEEEEDSTDSNVEDSTDSNVEAE